MALRWCWNNKVTDLAVTLGRAREQVLRGVYRLVLCLDADNAGQWSGPEIGRMAKTLGCKVEYLTSAHLDGAKDPAEYWQAHRTLPAFLNEFAAEEQCDLDDELIDEYARRYSAAHIAETLTRQYARREHDERSPQLRKTIVDWEAFATARAALGDAVLPQERPTLDDGPDDGDTGEWFDLEP